MDAAGSVTSRMRYHPYGQVWTQSAAPATDKLFTGHTRLGVRSGMYYAGARFYSGDLGRFMSADSIVPGAGDPQALNRYAYVRGNPLRFSDPTGHRLMDDAAHSGTCRLSCYDDAILRNCEFPRCRPDSGRGGMARTCQTNGWGAATLCTGWRRAAPTSLVEDLVYGAAADFAGGPFDDVYLGARESWRCTFGAGCNPLMFAAVVPMCPKACGTLASKALRISDEAADVAKVSRKTAITFSMGDDVAHGGRHLSGTGLDRLDVEAAITTDIAARKLPSDGLFKGHVRVEEQTVIYNGYVLSSGRVNVGTYRVLDTDVTP